MKISKWSQGCGALVKDVDLASMLDPDIARLKETFTANGVLFFRDQNISPDDHHAFARQFGSIVVNKFFKPVEGHPEIAQVCKEKTQEMNIGGGWHTDHSYDAEPAMGSILVARDLPASGGNTHFADLAKAFDALSPGLQKTLAGLRALHSNRHLYGEDGYYRTTDLASQLGGMDRVGDAVHPVVIRHPESGAKVLYVNPAHTIKFDGWSRAESAPLLSYLYDHVQSPEFTCEFNWQPGSVAIWDNRRTWHFAPNDYPGQYRLMHRITLAGSALEAA